MGAQPFASDRVGHAPLGSSATRALLLLLLVAGCDRSPPDECEKLKPTFMAFYEEILREAVAKSPSGGGGSLGFDPPDPQVQFKRELAQVRSHFVGACRKAGASEVARCVELARVRRASPRDKRPPDDAACQRMDDVMEAELFRGFE